VLGADDGAIGEELAVLVGDPDGDWEGCALGEVLGADDGAIGEELAVLVGDPDGDWEGCALGEALGADGGPLGEELASLVGDPDGDWEGCALGEALGADDGPLGEELAVPVGDPDGDWEGCTLGETLGNNDGTMLSNKLALGESLGLADGSLHVPQLARQRSRTLMASCFRLHFSSLSVSVKALQVKLSFPSHRNVGSSSQVVHDPQLARHRSLVFTPLFFSSHRSSVFVFFERYLAQDFFFFPFIRNVGSSKQISLLHTPQATGQLSRTKIPSCW